MCFSPEVLDEVRMVGGGGCEGVVQVQERTSGSWSGADKGRAGHNNQLSQQPQCERQRVMAQCQRS